MTVYTMQLKCVQLTPCKEEEVDIFEEFMVEAVAGRKYTEGMWMYMI